MRKISSLSNQGQQAIISCIALGESKRRAMHQAGGGPDWKIYSVAYLNDLKATNKDLMQYIHKKHPECKYIREIKPEMIQEWINDKKKGGVSQSQLGKLMTHVIKLQKCYKHKYSGINLHLEAVTTPICQIGVPDKQRDLVMDDETYKTVLATMPKNTETWKSVVLSHALGLRIAETANIHADRISLTGGRWGFGQVVLNGSTDGTKGGRWRTVDILSQEDLDDIKSCLDGVRTDQTVIRKPNGDPYKPDSLNAAIDRAMQKVGLADDWKQNKNHALRKNFAQRCYDLIRIDGGNKKKAVAYANQQLGHGDNRRDLTSVYIANQW